MSKTPGAEPYENTNGMLAAHPVRSGDADRVLFQRPESRRFKGSGFFEHLHDVQQDHGAHRGCNELADQTDRGKTDQAKQ